MFAHFTLLPQGNRKLIYQGIISRPTAAAAAAAAAGQRQADLPGRHQLRGVHPDHVPGLCHDALCQHGAEVHAQAGRRSAKGKTGDLFGSSITTTTTIIIIIIISSSSSSSSSSHSALHKES
jgi:hypothetical protein